jgi:hypothetical protein
MNTKTRSSATDTTPGFATRLTDETDLGIAMLIAEDDDGELPRGRAGLNDLRERMRNVENGGEAFCPALKYT